MSDTKEIPRHLSRQTALTALVYFLPLALLISIILWSFYHRETVLARNRLEQQAINTVTLQKAKIDGDFKLIAADLLFLSNYNQLLDMLEDPRRYKRRVTEDLLLFSRGKKIYDQIRVLDSTGMEVIRINFSGDKPVMAPERELQFKGERYYFKDTAALQKGEIFISPFDLNIEHDAIELPLKPTIRFGTPIFDRNGRRRGIVIFNYLGANLIREMKEVFVGSLGHSMLLNAEGYWLVGRDAGEEWGFMYADGKEKTLQKRFPGAWHAVSAADTGQVSNKEGLFTFDTVYPLIEGWRSSAGSGEAFTPSPSEKTAREYYWKIVSFIPRDYLKAAELLDLKKYILINAIAIVLLAVGSWVMAGARLARREADKSLRQSHDDLERAVTVRTFDLDKANQELRQSEERLRSVIGQSPVGIAFSRDGITLDANKVYLGMFGYADIEELRGKSLIDQIAPQSRPEILDRIRRRAQGETVETSYETIGLRKDGSQFPFFVSVSRVVLSDGPLTISFFIDITERKQADAELEKHREHLEELVKDRTAALQDSQQALMNIVEDLNQKTNELEQVNVKLKEVDRLKSLFIASMSHELRTPLNSVIGFSSILLNEWVGALNSEQKENLATVLKSGKHLLALINDVIDVSKIEAGVIDVLTEDFDLHDVISEAAGLFEQDMNAKGLEFIVENLHQPMHTDRRRLLQCVINLVSNAMKFTEKGSVRVQARLTKDERRWTKGEASFVPTSEASDRSSSIKIIVEDTGIGINKDDLPKLFHSFVRLDSPLRTTVLGTGLGLYLTKKFATEVLKGDVAVTSEGNKGSKFAILIPVRT